jgi:hypothetical protein
VDRSDFPAHVDGGILVKKAVENALRQVRWSPVVKWLETKAGRYNKTRG